VETMSACTRVARYTIKRTLCTHEEDPRPNYRYRAFWDTLYSSAETHHCAVGFDCMDLTPPSTGTATVRLSRGDGDAIA